MAKKKINPLIPGAIIVSALGVGYYWWTLKDNTPVGLTITIAVKGYVMMPENHDSVVTLGSFRKDKDSLSISSEDESNPMLVVMKDETPIDAQIIKLDDLYASPEEEEDLSQEAKQANWVKHTKNLKPVWAGFGFDTDPLDEMIAEMEGNTESAEAETIYGPRLSLQSHFVW